MKYLQAVLNRLNGSEPTVAYDLWADIPDRSKISPATFKKYLTTYEKAGFVSSTTDVRGTRYDPEEDSYDNEEPLSAGTKLYHLTEMNLLRCRTAGYRPDLTYDDLLQFISDLQVALPEVRELNALTRIVEEHSRELSCYPNPVSDDDSICL